MMRRTFISTVLMLLMCWAAQAKPARPGVHQYIQPDGSKVSIILHGDDFNHWATDPSGNLMEIDADGFYRLSVAGKKSMSSAYGHQRRRRAQRHGAYMTTGERHIPVVLVEFADVHFSFENIEEMFHAMLNEEGYSAFGATGSVRDFYVENSHGLYTPVFDVLEPVRLQKNMAFYGGNVNGDDKAPELALYEACVALDETTDFTIFDADEDGFVDMCLMYFAGYDEAEHGPSNAIWSHMWSVQNSNYEEAVSARFDGIGLGTYFTTSELTGNTGTVFGGIGGTCHEFGHSLGLPDFYDTDYAQNGSVGGLYEFSTMDAGNYNNEGRTPPYFNFIERQILGWVDEMPLLPEGDVVWAPIQDNVAYMVPASAEGEFYYWEYRNSTGWDAPLPEGLLLYHIDKSPDHMVNGFSADYLWENWSNLNNLNTNSKHPLAYLIPSSKPSSVNFTGSLSGIVYPGIAGVVKSDPKDWDNNGTDYQLLDISLSPEGARAYVLKGHGSNISGLVTTQDGMPVTNALISSDISENLAITNQEGRFILDLDEGTEKTPFTLTISGEGYRRAQVEGVLDWRSAYLPVTLMRSGESSIVTLIKYDNTQKRIFYPLPSPDYGDCMGSVLFRSDELFRFTGRRLETVRFSTYLPDSFTETPEKTYVIVDIGGERVLTQEVEEPLYGLRNENVVDISAAGIIIPDGADINIGYGIVGSPYPYPLGVTMAGHEGNSFYGKLNLEESNWQPMAYDKVSTGYLDLILSAGVRENDGVSSLADMGYASINLSGQSFKEGDTLPLEIIQGSYTPVSVTWLYDGEIVLDANSVVLTKGIHTIQAIVDYCKERSETLRSIITCE